MRENQTWVIFAEGLLSPNYNYYKIRVRVLCIIIVREHNKLWFLLDDFIQQVYYDERLHSFLGKWYLNDDGVVGGGLVSITQKYEHILPLSFDASLTVCHYLKYILYFKWQSNCATVIWDALLIEMLGLITCIIKHSQSCEYVYSFRSNIMSNLTGNFF